MARKVQRRDVLKTAGVAGAAGLAGCISSLTGDGTGTEDGGGGGSRTINYGVLLPLTGDLGSVGKPMRDAAVLPGKQLDGADLGGLSVESQVEDTATSPQTGIQAANSLVNNGVPGICGPASSGVNIQVAKQVFIPNQVVGCSPSSTSPAVTDLDDDGYIFRTAPSDALQGQVLGQIASDRVNASTAATLYVNNDYGQLLSQEFTKAFENNGGEVLQEVAFQKQQSSYTSKIQSALDGDPDALIVIGYPASGIQLFKDYYDDYSADRDILLTDGLRDPKIAKQVGADLSNIRGSAPQPSGPAADSFASQFQDEYDTEPGIFNAHSYDASASLILANAAGGENSGTAIRDNMQAIANPDGEEITASNLAKGVRMAKNGEAIMYEGASSSVDYDDNGDMKAVTYAVWKFTEDGTETVDTIPFEA